MASLPGTRQMSLDEFVGEEIVPKQRSLSEHIDRDAGDVPNWRFKYLQAVGLQGYVPDLNPLIQGFSLNASTRHDLSEAMLAQHQDPYTPVSDGEKKVGPAVSIPSSWAVPMRLMSARREASKPLCSPQAPVDRPAPGLLDRLIPDGSVRGGAFNLCSATLGAGALSLPYAFKQAVHASASKCDAVRPVLFEKRRVTCSCRRASLWDWGCWSSASYRRSTRSGS